MTKVYFLKKIEFKKIKTVLPNFKQPLGVKVHFGERGNETFISASVIKQITDLLQAPTLIECNVLYKGSRTTKIDHLEIAKQHGFNFAPIDILDGELGEKHLELSLKNCSHFNKVYIGKGLEKYNSLLVISHFKGHISAGFGGAIKNLGMGLASRQGKLALHASIKHQINSIKCIACGQCLENCPVNAINWNSYHKAQINQNLCVSCSKCIALCSEKAIEIPWQSTKPETLQERIAEYTLAITDRLPCFFINFLTNITEHCDCIGQKLPLLTPDIGLLLSTDPVAIDQASYDLITKHHPPFQKFKGLAQLEYGEKIGLGSKDYQLINL